jgi:dTDP-4-amino-4,6-dideoxygalactose transaminase
MTKGAGFIPFALPELDQEEIDEVVDTLRSGWLTTGPKAKRFEADFRDWLGEDVEVVAVNSATAGLHLALEALGVGAGDEVITTTHTFTATAEIVRYLGAHPVLVDVSRETLCIDPALVERKITSRTKAVIPVHFGGHAADMQSLLDLASRRGIAVVEDAAHALTSTCAGKPVGTLSSDATVFSFYANKTITTGEGGMLVTRNREIARRARIMRLHGISRDAFDRFVAEVPSWYYEVVAPGFKYNLTDIAASLGIHQLRKAHAFRQRRAEIAELYDSALAGLPVLLPPRPSNGDVHSWHLYAVQLDEAAPIERDAFIDRMFSYGVGVSVHYIPLHLHPYWRNTYGLEPQSFPNSQRAYERTASLPIYSKMTDEDVGRVIEALQEILR